MNPPFSLMVKLFIILFTGLLLFEASAQQGSIRRGGIVYVEQPQIGRISSVVDYEQMRALLTSVVPGATSGDVPNAFTIQGEDYEVAGFCFIPIWDIQPQQNEADRASFKTIGLRIVVAFWKKNRDCATGGLDLVYIGGGFERVSNAVEPLQPNYERLKNIASIELLFSNTSLDIGPGYSREEMEELHRSSREFDFVFLEYDRFLELATSVRYFPNQSRADNALLIERSLIKYDVWNDEQAQFEVGNFRSLSFRPYPVPDLPDSMTIAAIALEDGKRCPPYWWAFDDPRGDLMDHTLNRFACPTEEFPPREEEVTPVEKKVRRLAISAHILTSTKFDNPDDFFSKDPSYEFDLEYAFSERNALELLVGSYLLPAELEASVFGVNLLYKQYFPFKTDNPKKTSNTALFFSAGVSANDLPSFSELQFGIILNTGFRQPLFSERLFLEAGIQYQHLTYFENNNSGLNLLSLKAGLKFDLIQKTSLRASNTTPE